MEFARPLLLLLVPLAGAVLWARLKRGGDPAAFRHPRLELLGQQSTGIRARLAGALPVLSGLGLVLLIIAAAGPRVAHRSEQVEGEGIDILLTLDISGSMRSLDFHPLDRLESAKEVIHGFIGGRPNDRIGLVVFAARSFTQCPLTLDHSGSVLEQVADLQRYAESDIFRRWNLKLMFLAGLLSSGR